VFIQLINTAYPLPLDMAYPSSGTEANSKFSIFDFRAKIFFYLSLEQILLIFLPVLQEVLIRASRLIKKIEEVMTELISEKYMERAQTESHLSITSNDIYIELSKEFLEELQMNAYRGWIDEDVINHIAMVLKMIDLIYIPGVDSYQLRMKIFPLSLADEAKQWWINEGEGKITIWEELVEKFFCKFLSPILRWRRRNVRRRRQLGD
ncbi:hypothetical protein Tco_1383849, partial [Tanacetum coccineum]